MLYIDPEKGIITQIVDDGVPIGKQQPEPVPDAIQSISDLLHIKPETEYPPPQNPNLYKTK